MSSFLLLSNLDVGRAFGADPGAATPESIAKWLLEEYARKPGGGFNYNTAIEALRSLFGGKATTEQAIAYCETHGNPKGRKQNAQVVACIAPYALANLSRCYRKDFAAVPVGRVHGRTAYVGIKAPLVRVGSDGAFVVMPGFRKTYRPVAREIDVACSIALATLARDDLAEADFEYLDAGLSDKEGRILQAFHGRDRHIYSADDVDALLDVYVRGVALALESGISVREANLRGYRVIDPDQTAFF